MPTDGEALVAFIAGCSAPGENAAAWTSKIRDASNSYFNRVGSHRKTGKTGSGGFSAADAKKEAGNLVKIANSSLKQQALLMRDQDEIAKQLLGCAELSIGILHEMQAHLSCSAIELEKMSQNMIQKLIDRGLGKRARHQSEAMLIRLASMIAGSFSCTKEPAASHNGNDKENRSNNGKKGAKQLADKNGKGENITDWRDALAALTETKNACRNVSKDENVLVLACLVNLATCALQQPPASAPPHPVLHMCGSGCLQWLQRLLVVDTACAQRLAGSLYRLTSMAAAQADACTGGDQAGSVDAALQLRQVSLVYLAASGKVGVEEVVAQVVKTAKHYDAHACVRGTTRMQGFHTRLIDTLAPMLLQLVPKDKACEHALALADWSAGYCLSLARSFKATASTQAALAQTPRDRGRHTCSEGLSFARKMEELFSDLDTASEDEWTSALFAGLAAVEAIVHLASSRAPYAASSSASSPEPAALSLSDLRDRVKQAVVAVQGSIAWAARAGAAAFHPLHRIGMLLDGVRVLCSSLLGSLSPEHQTLVETVQELLVMQSSLQAALAAGAACCGTGGAGASKAGRREESVRWSLEALLTCLRLHSVKGLDTSQCSPLSALADYAQATRAHGAGALLPQMAIAVSSPLFNVAVAAYNAAKFADAVGPLRTTCQVCELLVEDLAALPAADLVQLGKRHRMLAFCLQRSCLLPEAVENAARAAALLALGGDWDSADSALQEAVALRSSFLSKESSEASTQMIKARESISTSTLMQVAGLEQELTSADACLPFLEAELWASLAARHVPVEAVLDVCLRLVAAPAACAKSWAMRGRVLLEKAKLMRAHDVTAGASLPDAVNRKCSAKGTKSKAAASKGRGQGAAIAKGQSAGAFVASIKATETMEDGTEGGGGGGGRVSLEKSQEALDALLEAAAAWEAVKGNPTQEEAGSLQLMRSVASELGGVYAWRAVLLLQDSGEGGVGRQSGDALQAAVTSLAIFDAVSSHLFNQRRRGQEATLPPLGFSRLGAGARKGSEKSGHGHGWELARAQAHVSLLADIFSLHGQETLQLRALETAAGLASVSEGNCDTQDGKHVQSGMNNRDEVVNRFALAAECGLVGLSEAAARCLVWSSNSGGQGGKVEEAEDSLLSCMSLVARASVKAAEGCCNEAHALLEHPQVTRLATDNFRALNHARHHIGALYASVKCETSLQRGQGHAAARHAVAAVHALLAGPWGPMRIVTAAATVSATTAAATRASSVAAPGQAEDGESGAASGATVVSEASTVDMSAYGGLVCNRSSEASHFRHMHQVARALARAGELFTVMGLAREAAYYLEQGMQVAKGCASVYWHTRFLRLVAALRLAEQDLARARQCAEEADFIIEAATRAAHHPSDPQTFLAAERFHLHALSARVHASEGNVAGARQGLEAARTSLASTRARAEMHCKQPQVLLAFMSDVSAQTMGSCAWLIEMLASGCAGEVDADKHPKLSSCVSSSSSKAAPVEDWRVKYGFKQPAPGVKSKSVLSTASCKGKDASSMQSKFVRGPLEGIAAGRGGCTDEHGLTETLAVLESDVLVFEGRANEGLSVLQHALAPCEPELGTSGRAQHRAAVPGWMRAELQMRMGLLLLAHAEQFAENDGTSCFVSTLTDLGNQLEEMHLECNAEDDLDRMSGPGGVDVEGDGVGGKSLPSAQALNAMKVAELKTLLEERGLATTGRKADLIVRLQSASSASPAPRERHHGTARASSKTKAAESSIHGPKAQGVQKALQAKDRGRKGDTWQDVSNVEVGMERQEGLKILLSAWEAIHPAGPPLLIRRCARALGSCLRSTDPEAAEFFMASSFAVTARQQMAEALVMRSEKRKHANHDSSEEPARSQGACEGSSPDGAQLAALEMRVHKSEQLPVKEKGKALPKEKTAQSQKVGTTMQDNKDSNVVLLQGREWLQAFVETLPEAWAVVILSREAPMSGDGASMGGGLRATRLEKNAPVLSVQIRAGHGESGLRSGGMDKVLQDFDEIMKLSRAGLESGADAVSTEEKKTWWNDRKALDRRLEALVQRVQNDWLDAEGHLPVLLGRSRPAGGPGSQHVLLVPDEDLQVFPWEALPALASRSISRMPSLPILLSALLRAPLVPDGSGGAVVRADSRNCFYVVNPSGDLAHTQAAFEAAFAMQPWEGVTGRAPDAQQLLCALRTLDLFAYCGHGAGERYLGGEGGEKIRASDESVKATAILMGCSSGRLKRTGPLEPRGMALNYLMAGCPLAIGCLWDVSDRDIDRFADFLFRAGGVYPILPPRVPTDTKGSRTGFLAGLSLEDAASDACATLPVAVTKARSSVRMRFLIGAAPVCYGLPVSCSSVT